MFISRSWNLSAAGRDVEAAPEEGQAGFSDRRSCCGLWASLLNALAWKVPLWGLFVLLIVISVLCVGSFELERLFGYILPTRCTVLNANIMTVGTCTWCSLGDRMPCANFSISTAKIRVSFVPHGSQETVYGDVWYCKGRAAADPCDLDIRFLDQFVLDYRDNMQLIDNGPIPCTTPELNHYLAMHHVYDSSIDHACYYSSRDPAGEDVWFSVPTPALVTQAWLQTHSRVLLLWAGGCLVLFIVLLGCFALDGAELGVSGLL